MADEIGDKEILRYLETQSDFDLEQFVYRSLLERGIEATFGGTYVDSVTRKCRQYDIRARKVYQGACGISMAIECKRLTPQFPLVVSRVPRPDSESVHEVIHSGVNPVTAGRFMRRPRRQDGRGIYRKDEKVGKKAVQIRWDSSKHNSLVASDSDSYDKWSQALSSADDLIAQAYQAFRTIGGDEFVTFVMPILVVSDATLWVADYCDVGDREGPPVQVEETTLFVDREYELGNYGYYIGHLHVYTRSGVSSLLDELARPESRFRERVFGFVQREAWRS